ncbi:MAG: succinyl-diaminopimelate desuccinylase [Alphaproteobacteria bacterium]|nr:MAG: succinyl-diaminopimelate desuccinylase [Alphaproteobacteria bacterium]
MRALAPRRRSTSCCAHERPRGIACTGDAPRHAQGAGGNIPVTRQSETGTGSERNRSDAARALVGSDGSVDAVALTRALIRCRSITPADDGALDVLEGILKRLGFTCHRLSFSEPGTAAVDNLYARLGDAGPNFCFAGHTDVVPPGDTAAWSVDPFAGAVIDDHVIGRGAADMKGAIGCFIAALADFLKARGSRFDGSISLLITGDEEAEAVNGTRKVLDWLAARGTRIDACLVGEPTSNEAIADMVKIGRRGSLSAWLRVHGTQGHVAYPDLADNPVHHLVRMLDAIIAAPLDDGSAHFPPSTLQITTIDVDNPVGNVIPAEAQAAFNVRFNDRHRGADVEAWLRARFDQAIDRSRGARYELETRISAESFLSPPGPLSELVCTAAERVTGRRPVLGTTGGTSDARFIKDWCPVVELGLLNATAHKVDERVAIADLAALGAIYAGVLDGFFAP